MIAFFFQEATTNVFKGFGNIFFNGFASDLSEEDQVRWGFAHFNPISKWSVEEDWVIDQSTGDEYYDDSTSTIRLKCAGLFAASLILQPIGLTLNLLNKIAKIVTFAHLWKPSEKEYEYNFKARIGEWGKDILLVTFTPLILVGMLFATLYGTTLSPYDGRKLYASCERLVYSGGYQFFHIRGSDGNNLHDFFLAPCFQPYPKAHLGGGKVGEKDVW